MIRPRLPALLAILAFGPIPAPLGARQAPRPDLIVIVVDDLRFDEFGAAGHPYVKTPNIDRLAREGATFDAAYNVTPLCSPNRASILTGQYPSRHGILDNVARSLQSHRLETYPRALQRAGYETAMVGKWHMGNDPTPRPGFDYWVSFPGQGRTVDPELFEQGALHPVKGYITDLLTDRAVAFISRPRDRPYALYLAHKAIHPDAIQRDDGSIDLSAGMRYIPAPRHEGTYDNAVFPRRGNAAPPNRSEKPVVRRALDDKAAPAVARVFGAVLDSGTSEASIRRRAEMLLAVDEGLGRLFEVLERTGRLDRTAILFTSDNGYFFGEHGLSIERRLPYEEAARAPLLVRYPPLVRPGSHVPGFALSIDIAPTMLELAGAPVPGSMQGRSLVPLLGGAAARGRTAFLIEYASHENPMPWLLDLSYRAIRSGPYKLIHWLQHPDEDELYDLAADPLESRNLIHDPARRELLARLRTELGQLVLRSMGLAPAAR